MSRVLNTYKPQGLTPFQLAKQLKIVYPEFENVKIGYAGRLDPLAHGVMVLLVGEENKKREKYLGMEKEYEFRVLLGVETDTYDYLGILSREYTSLPSFQEEEIEKFVQEYTGDLTLKYPPFSSKTLNGTPLFKLAKKNKLVEADIPERQVRIEEFKYLSVEKKSSVELKKEIIENLRKIRGFFRQKKVIAGWMEFFKKYPEEEFILLRFSIKCSSGTYVRTLAHLLGNELGCGAIAYEIYRMRVGDYRIEDSLRL